MNAESKISVHYSSLVDLKAELLRKQAECEALKQKVENEKINKVKASNKKRNKKQKGKKIKNETFEEDIETRKIHEKSQLMLKAKSRLYKTLSKTHVNMNSNFLVDFEHKISDSDHSEEEFKGDNNDDQNSEEEFKGSNNDDPDSDNEWVEYTDCFGRSRKCLREDLPKMQEKDEYLRKKIVEKPSEEVADTPLYKEYKQPVTEPEIEMMRRKWEEQTAKLADKVNIHYQDILFDEARTHGVGYYAFSQDEEERAKQQETLLKLRKETEQKQKEKEVVRDIKDKIQQNRLKVARLRQRVRAGLPIDNEEEENKHENTEKEEIKMQNEKIENERDNQHKNQDIAKLKLEEIENKVQAFGELLGKRNKWYVMSQEEWVHKKRKERLDEFAPIYTNFEHSGCLNLNDSAISPSTEDSGSIASMAQSIQEPDLKSSSLAHVSNIDIKTETSTISEDSTVNKNVNIADQIEAGLKYLRKQFENKHS